jgi:alcohol dehydrogenase (NADP+)
VLCLMCINHRNITTRVLSVPSAKAPFEKTTIERRDLWPDDVLIDIKFAVFATPIFIMHTMILTGVFSRWFLVMKLQAW